MLAKFLAGKSFFVKLFLLIIFLGLFFLKEFPLELYSIRALTVLLLLLTGFLSLVFLTNSKLINVSGYIYWYLLPWLLVFSDVISSIELTILLLFQTVLLWRLFNHETFPERKRAFIEIGMLLVISFFVHPLGGLIVGAVLLGLIYLQSLNFKTIILFLTGLILSALLGIQLLYLFDRIAWLQSIPEYFCLDWWNTTPWLLLPIGFMLFLSWGDHILQFRKQDAHKRRRYFLTVLYFINWFVIIALFGREHPYLMIFLGIPVTLFLSRFTQYLYSLTLKNVLLWSYMVFISGFYFQEEIFNWIAWVYNEWIGNVTL